MIEERPEPSGDRRRLLLVAGGLIPVVLGIGLILAATLIFAGQGKSEVADADVAAAMREAGCTLESFPAEQGGRHLKDINARPRYNSFPATSGPHSYAPVAWGFWGGPLLQVQVVHNLEHGGIVIYYGSAYQIGTPVLDQLLKFFASEFPGPMLMAPLPKLGKRTIALAAWTGPEPGSKKTDYGKGRLAKCTRFDEDAFRAFVDAYRGKGPEGLNGGPARAGGS